eukprot:jgi/Mesen1/3083/ME000183S02134
MPREGSVVSINEKEFILAAVREEKRIDERTLYETRPIHFAFLREDGVVELQMGQTRVLAVVTAELGQPYKDRPNEGSLSVFTEFSPMADPEFEPGRPGEAAIELGRIVDRGLRESRALDTEALCVVAGRAVWAVRIDIHILDNGGNLVDAANLAALAALLSFRRPECSVGGDDGQTVTVHPPEVRDPVPLSIHHLPIAVTFAFFNDGDNMVIDPSLKEEAVMGGRLTFTVNAHGEICAVQKGGGVPVTSSEILRCARIAANKALDITDTLKQAVEKHAADRQARKVKRHPGAGGATDLAATWREVLLRDRDMAIVRIRAEGAADVPAGGDAAAMDVEEADDAPAEEEEEEEEEDDDDDDDEEEEEGEEEEGELREEAGAGASASASGSGGARSAAMEVEHGNGSSLKRPKSAELFSGGASQWGLEERRPKKGAPAGGGRRAPPGVEALDEFDAVARMISDAAAEGAARAATPAGAGAQPVGSLAAAAVYAAGIAPEVGGGPRGAKPPGPRSFAVDSDEEEGAAMELQGEFAGAAIGAGKRAGKAAAAKQEDVEETLLAAVKPKGRRRPPGGKG